MHTGKKRRLPLVFVSAALLVLGIATIIGVIAAELVGGGSPSFGSLQRVLIANGVILSGIAVLLFMAARVPREDAFFRILIRFALVVTAFIVADIISRPFLMYHRSPIERRFPADVTRRPKPYVMFGGTAGGRLEHEKDVLNHLGYRGRTPSPEKNPGEFRVFALGGSALVNGNPPLPVLLEEEFRRNGYDNVNVYNFGVVSSVSGMEVSRIYAEIAGFHPDLILMYNGSNDIYTPLQADPRPGYPFNFIVYENNPLLESDVREYPVIPLLLYGSTLCRNLFSSYFLKKFVPLQAVREEAGYLSGEWKKAIADTYVRNLVKAHKLSKAFGAEFIAFVQPALPLRKDPPEEEKKYAGPAAMRHYVDVYEMVSAGIESVKRDEGVKIFDLGGLYDGRDGRVFYDICHTYQEEKPAAAKALYEHIVAAINIPCMNEKQEGASRFSGHSVNGNTCP